ncbi:right-handed parallel beta-helix repeat-containing protein [Butyrivibrio sp. MC2013]|uniref:right-handed parallel beta-helix repeat-containing protein n=1 Tax=Butyrivibrio sp. MC2013 TaxID=1280686 RepID=UPI00040321B7|nr:right-handed parallel beta-helix repeat-containing protein [Butyrivibrio sp. MC2013]
MRYYVAADRLTTGDGSLVHPFSRISDAAKVARPGDEVIVAPGVYREWVDPPRGGSRKHRITYRSQIKHGAVITGAEIVDHWERIEGGIWRASVPCSIFGERNPYTEYVKGDWYNSSKVNHLGDLYLNGKSMYEVHSIEEVRSPKVNRDSWVPEDTVFVWYCEESPDHRDMIFYANFRRADPRKETIEISVRPHCFYPSREGCGYISLQGFTVRQAACQWAPPTALQEGMIGPHWSKGWIIEDCDISEAKCAGISLGKYYQEGNDNKWTNEGLKDGTQTQRDASCRALIDGWDKKNIGSHIVRRCEIHDCGQAGIVGNLGAVFSQIEDNHIHHINCKHNLEGAEIGGIKLHAAIDVQIRHNRIHHCTRGLWLDWQAQGTRVSSNLFYDNTPPKGCTFSDGLAVGEDIFVEVSHGPTLIDNNLLLSDFSLRLSTQGIALVHNFIAGSMTFVGRGTDNGGRLFATDRYTPYHEPHSTAITGFMTILHGDARIFNNVFVQKPISEELMRYAERNKLSDGDLLNFSCGTGPYEDYPEPDEYKEKLRTMSMGRDTFYDHLPVSYEGNCYFGGARPSSHDKDCYCDPDSRISWKLEDNNGMVEFSTDLFAFMPAGKDRIINSDILGCAFESEQRFEDADGSFLVLDTDIRGVRRKPSTSCGPFEGPGERFILDWDERAGYGEKKSIAEKPRLIPLKERGGYIDGPREDGRPEKEDKKHDDIMPKEEDDKAEDDRAKEGEGRSSKRELICDIAMTECDDITVMSKERTRRVSEIFIKNNIVWVHLENDSGLTEIDCEYGIGHFVPSWSMEADNTIRATKSDGSMALGRTIAALLRIYIDSDLQNPETIERQILGSEGDILSRYGIELRFRGRQLRLIRDKKFITIEEAAEVLSRASGDVITEEL